MHGLLQMSVVLGDCPAVKLIISFHSYIFLNISIVFAKVKVIMAFNSQMFSFVNIS